MLTAITTDFSGPSELTSALKAKWGGKGAGLLSMAASGLPVPEALVISTDAWRDYRATGDIHLDVKLAVYDFLAAYPDALFSVRSGAPVSMPGMMDTVLNVGATPETSSTHPRAYERFAEAWLGIVHGVPKARIEAVIATARQRAGTDEKRFAKLLSLLIAKSYVALPTTRVEQALACVEAVFRSWDTPRAKVYRDMHGIDEGMGTACVVQRMVMGNAPGFSGTGVMFSRDPATGEPKLKGEIAFNAQGEDVVSGAVTPRSLDTLSATVGLGEDALLTKLKTLADNLEATYGDVQDVEFTVEDGTLYVLQTRTAKMSAKARIITACALAKGTLTERHDFIRARVTPATVEASRVPVVQADSPSATGLAASPGAVVGRVVFRDTPLDQIDKGCILVAHDTAPEDFPRMAKAGAIFTAVGGFTCHSAVVARGIGCPAVVGCEGLSASDSAARIGAVILKAGTKLTLCGTTGRVWVGERPVEAAKTPAALLEHLKWIAVAQYGHGVATYDFLLPGMTGAVVIRVNPTSPEAVAAAVERCIRLNARGRKAYIEAEAVNAEDDVFPGATVTVAIPADLAIPQGSKAVDLIALLNEGV